MKSAEEVIQDWARSNAVHRWYARDVDVRRKQLRDDRVVSTSRTPIGMRQGGTLRHAAEIPFIIWFKDQIARPNLSDQERARSLMVMFPEFNINGSIDKTMTRVSWRS